MSAKSSLPATPEGPSLQDSLVIHHSQLEIDRDAALAAAAPRVAARYSSSQEVVVGGDVSLADTVVVRKSSQLEQARDAALAENAPRIAARYSSTQEAAVGGDVSLQDSLLVHKSRLELMKEAAAAAAQAATAAGGETQPRRQSAYEGPSLEEVRGSWGVGQGQCR